MDKQTVIEEIRQNRSKLTERLLKYSLTDTLLFFSDNQALFDEQKQKWNPLLKWYEDFLQTKIKSTQTLKVDEENLRIVAKLEDVFNNMSDENFAKVYYLACNMRSVALGLAVICGFVDLEKAFDAAFLEEMWQSKEWGEDNELAQRRKDLLNQSKLFLELFA